MPGHSSGPDAMKRDKTVPLRGIEDKAERVSSLPVNKIRERYGRE